MGEVNFRLSAAERAEIAKPVNGQGGYQTLLNELRGAILPNGDIVISDEQLGRIVRMCAYGTGGFQGRLRAAFRNHIRDLVSW